MKNYEGATCVCGSAWFELRGEGGAPSGFTLDERGVVTGFTGTPTCKECGEVWVAARDRMRLVR